MRLAVVGAGGVGGYFGGMLARRGAEVWFLARGRHLAAMRDKGLTVEASDGAFVIPPTRISGSPDEIGPVDVVLFCVKSYDTEGAARILPPLLTGESLVVSLQNGIDNEGKIARIIPAGTVLGGVSYIFATIAAPGKIVETGGREGPRKIIFGPLSSIAPAVEEKSHALVRLFHDAGMDAEYTADIATAIWKKFILITGLAGLTALTRLSLGEILAVDETRALLLDALEETAAVARAEGVNIGPGFAEEIIERLANAESGTRSSLHYDLTHGKPLEIEALSGTVVRLGTRQGVPTPTHRIIYSALLPYHLQHTHSFGRKPRS